MLSYKTREGIYFSNKNELVTHMPKYEGPGEEYSFHPALDVDSPARNLGKLLYQAHADETRILNEICRPMFITINNKLNELQWTISNLGEIEIEYDDDVIEDEYPLILNILEYSISVICRIQNLVYNYLPAVKSNISNLFYGFNLNETIHLIRKILPASKNFDKRLLDEKLNEVDYIENVCIEVVKKLNNESYIDYKFHNDDFITSPNVKQIPKSLTIIPEMYWLHYGLEYIMAINMYLNIYDLIKPKISFTDMAMDAVLNSNMNHFNSGNKTNIPYNFIDPKYSLINETMLSNVIRETNALAKHIASITNSEIKPKYTETVVDINNYMSYFLYCLCHINDDKLSQMVLGLQNTCSEFRS